MDYSYKGYKIGYRSLEWDKYKKGYCWNVHKIGSDSNVCFETIREAKEWINKQTEKRRGPTIIWTVKNK